MVDFQSRDTRRGLGDDDESDSTETPESGGDAQADAETPDTESESGGDTHSASEATDAEHGDSHEQEHDHEQGHDHEQEHDHDHHHDLDVGTLGVAVVTVSSSRSLDDDAGGDTIQAAVEGADHEVAVRDLIRDEFDGVQSAVSALTGRDDVDAVVLTGGTGVTPDDVTVEAVDGLFDKTLPGFGELFRSLSYDEIGTKVIATRARAGIVDQVPVFCLPGSQDAARLGIEEIILPELEHLAGLARRER